MITLGNADARRVFLDRHALLDAPSGAPNGSALLDLITRLGFVQLDSINTVARAHDLTLFARRSRYRPEHLRRLYDRGGALFEHWTHDASVIPLDFFPWWRLRMQRDADKLVRQWRNWRRDGFEGQMQSVLDHIRDHGPCGSSDVGQDEKKGSGGWWDWHPSKTALEYLWRSGALAVVRRDGFRKVYDLTERVIEDARRNEVPEASETTDWCCNAALDRLGFATPGEIAKFWDHLTPAEAKAWATAALKRGEIAEICITQADGKPRKTLARPDIATDAALERTAPARLRVLSPFDPALRDRARARRLFGFDYTIEVFVPEAKRRYGYYVFPLMQGDRLVGRVDMKAHRDADKLHVRALWPEPRVSWGKGRHAAFEAELDRIRRLAGVEHVTWGQDWLRSD
ncbi:winged helix-turn-helix domain-containing protein [Aliishimia ponticola]|uniref:Winged helix-turn-helix domain-containing protein n=1 Tax=Aliishimia ponticola TaxID=2499833 RepID=A0A4S4NDR0_9RHOB|nr:crosslink repair DNA glycosylase YcaQ family protein [Aliishimia ponticola]THH36885.1 winged helix-turn-helix domain-containing protein [Aliishimia ponticola]